MPSLRLTPCLWVVLFVPTCFLVAKDSIQWNGRFIETSPVIDGVLDDSVWSDVQPITEFRQVEPISGGDPNERTKVYLAYEAHGIYFAVVAEDREPAGIIATQRKRDADLASDDSVVIVLDPFLDQRNGYYFAFNPLGAKQDALIRGGVTLNTDWDGIWEVAAKRTHFGWVAEGYLPLSTLSFKSNVPAWGLNIERTIARTGERIRWNGTERQYLVNNLANTGRLTGLSELRRAAGLELRPFVSVTYARDQVANESDTKFEPGFDLFYKLSDSTTAVLTVNTDFADAEVDDRVVNLTRFPVKFPEKRAFFLQDAGVFSYSLINNNPLPYYSRRIGLGPDGEVVNIVGGARISGREGPVNFGVLGVRTDPTGDIEAKELGVARVLFNLSDEASVGAIGTWGDPRMNGDAWLLGVDLNYTTGHWLGKTANLLDASLYYQTTDATGLDAGSDAFGWGLIYDSPTWGFVSYLDWVEEDYYPALGNIRQTGVYTITGKLDYELNPDWAKAVVPTFAWVKRHNLIFEDREFESFSLEATSESQRGDVLLLRIREEWEWLPESFFVGPGVAVLPGTFSDTRVEASLTLAKSRPVSTAFSVAKIPYYGGEQIAYTSELTWRPSAMFNFEAAYDYTSVRLPYARFPVRLIRLGSAVQFSETLVWSMLAQYDNLSETVGFNTRLRWTYAAGSDVFLVFNQGIDTENDRWEYTRSEATAKVGATIRF